ncbi:nucleoside triphosphate pyrophosphohydrolase [bacterium AH-315-K03]|nr:nucleoside triphosphate pyrophosphohydrolase [bacterium AH-315-K03]
MSKAYKLEDLLYLMERLRDPNDGCPWDCEQDFSSIVPHTIEESYELADAIERGDMKQIREELGDVLFQVVFYSQLGKEKDHFTIDDVISGLVEKLLRRHPHVFPTGQLHSRANTQTESTHKITKQWETLKSIERHNKQQSGVLDDIPIALPALTRAGKLQKRAAQTGFDWTDFADVLQKLQEEIGELSTAIKQDSPDEIEQEMGDVLFSCVNIARHLNVDSETALRRTNKKFEARFRYIEQTALGQGQTLEQLSLEQMDHLWDKAKSEGL